MQNRTNYIKSMLYFGNIEDHDIIEKSKCFTLQHFDYHLNRMLGYNNELLNATAESIMNLSIRVQPDDKLTDIYRVFNENTECIYTVIFNGEFDNYGNLTNYDNAIITKGMLMKIDEHYGRTTERTTTQRALLNISAVISNIKYIGGGVSVESVL